VRESGSDSSESTTRSRTTEFPARKRRTPRRRFDLGRLKAAFESAGRRGGGRGSELFVSTPSSRDVGPPRLARASPAASVAPAEWGIPERRVSFAPTVEEEEARRNAHECRQSCPLARRLLGTDDGTVRASPGGARDGQAGCLGLYATLVTRVSLNRSLVTGTRRLILLYTLRPRAGAGARAPRGPGSRRVSSAIAHARRGPLV